MEGPVLEPFEPLREMLLRGGVAPAHVRRYLSELAEHYCDLVDEAVDAGSSPAQAEAAARARLGADEALADAMLAQPSLRSWTGRAPWATLTVGPFLLLVLAWCLAVLGVVVLVGRPVDDTDALPLWLAWLPSEWLPRTWEMRLGTALLDLVQVGGPLLIVSWVAQLAARQRSRLIWPLLGCIAVALIGSSVFWDAQWPGVDPRDPLHRVSWSLTMGIRGYGYDWFDHHAHFSLAAWSQCLVMGSLNLAVATAVYWWPAWRRAPALA